MYAQADPTGPWPLAPDSVSRDAMVDFVRPGVDAAFDILEVFEPLFAQEFERFHRPDPALAMDIILRVGIQLREFLRERAEGKEGNPIDTGNLILIWLADIDDAHAKAGIIQRFLHVVHGHFIWVG